jgi:hypothetical protein
MGPPGHLGIGFAAKKVAPNAPLWSLLVASEVLDLLSAVFIISGIEKMAVTSMDTSRGIQTIIPGSVPWSHGLFMSVIWSMLAAGTAYLISKDVRTGGVLGLVVFSHWVLDLLVHAPDLPILFEDSPLLGFSLWTSGPGFVTSIIIELVLLAGGIAVYINWSRNRVKNQA